MNAAETGMGRNKQKKKKTYYMKPQQPLVELQLALNTCCDFIYVLAPTTSYMPVAGQQENRWE